MPVASASPPRDPWYRGSRFPAEIISHAVWLDSRVLLSERDVEALPAERGIAVRYGTVRRWCKTFGQRFAREVRRRRSGPGTRGTSVGCS